MITNQEAINELRLMALKLEEQAQTHRRRRGLNVHERVLPMVENVRKQEAIAMAIKALVSP